MKIRRNKKPGLSLELTPLVDVVFLLLTFYMLTSTFNKQQGLPLQLPSAEAADVVVDSSLTISVVDTEFVEIEEERVALSALTSYLQSTLKPETIVIIRSQNDKPIQSLVSVLDKVQQAGVAGVTIATDDPV